MAFGFWSRHRTRRRQGWPKAQPSRLCEPDGRLRFDLRRKVEHSTDRSRGRRHGRETFGRLAAGLNYHTARWMISPYTNFDVISGTLDTYSESAPFADEALAYNRQSFGQMRVNIGLRGSVTRRYDSRPSSVWPFIAASGLG